MLHPIHYSLICNGLLLVAGAVLAYLLTQPLIFVIAALMVNHMVGRFESEAAGKEPGNYEGSSGMGFHMPDDELEEM